MAAIGVLALQGDWAAHSEVLRALGAEVCTVRTAADLELVGSLIMPGGESTAMLRLMEPQNLAPAIADRAAAGMAILATCAGVILLAQAVLPEQPCLGVLDIDVERNAYGRQLYSTVSDIRVSSELGNPQAMEAVFIRAPRIVRYGPAVEILGRWGDDVVLVRQGKVLAATFHPELSDDLRVHELFLHMEDE